MQYITSLLFLALCFTASQAQAAPHSKKTMRGFYCSAETSNPKALEFSAALNNEIFQKVSASLDSQFSVGTDKDRVHGAVLHLDKNSRYVVGKISTEGQEKFFALVDWKSPEPQKILADLLDAGCDGLVSLVDFAYEETDFIDDAASGLLRLLIDILPSSQEENDLKNHGVVGIRG